MLTSTRWILPVTLLAGLAVPAAATAQDEPGRGAPERERQAAEPEAVRGAAQRPQDAAPGRGQGADRDAAIGEMKHAEVRHRERVAMIGRLRELAAAKGQTQRLAALDELERKEASHHARRIQGQRGRLGDAEFAEVERRLARGRQHSADKGKVTRRAGDKPVLPDVNEQQQRAAKERARNQQAEQDKAEAERVRKAQADKDKAAKEQAERVRQEQAKAERAKKDKEAAEGQGRPKGNPKPKAERKPKQRQGDAAGGRASGGKDAAPRSDKPRAHAHRGR